MTDLEKARRNMLGLTADLRDYLLEEKLDLEEIELHLRGLWDVLHEVKTAELEKGGCIRWGTGSDRCVLEYDHIGPCTE